MRKIIETQMRSLLLPFQLIICWACGLSLLVLGFQWLPDFLSWFTLNFAQYNLAVLAIIPLVVVTCINVFATYFFTGFLISRVERVVEA